MKPSDRTTYRSPAGAVTVDALTKQVLVVVNRLVALPKWGGETENMTATQGSFRPWTSYSGPTHRGCGAVDLTEWNWRNRFHWFDLLGVVPMHRTRSQGPWPNHMHVVTDGLGCVDPYAKGQIVETKAGRDGLKGSRPDPDAGRRSGLWPLAVFGGRTGRLTATRTTHLYDGPAGSRKVVADAPKGTQVTAIMEVRNGHGNKWFVTDQGLFGYSAKWTR